MPGSGATPSGALGCGLLDWGRVRQMNVAYALWGSLCGASLDIWDSHLEELLALFIAELHAHGGPRLDVAELELHLDFYVATMGLATLIDAPALVLSRLPEAAGARGPLDPVFLKDDVARGFPACLHRLLAPVAEARLRGEPGPVARAYAGGDLIDLTREPAHRSIRYVGGRADP